MTDPVPQSGALPRNVKVLGGASLLNDIASEMIFPLLPQFLIGVLGGNRLLLGLIEGVADSVASLLKLGAGAWSDRAGRRKSFVLSGYVLANVARPLLALAIVPWHAFASRVGDRIGKGIRTAPRDAIIADSTSPDLRGRAFGFHRAMDHLGAAIGPLLATAFLWYFPGQLRILFALTLLPGLLVLVLLVVGLRETARPAAETSSFRLSLQPFDRNFRLYLVSLVIFTLGNSSDAFLLVRAGEAGIPTSLLPLLWCGFHVLKSAGNFFSGRAVDQFGPRRMIVLGWTTYAGIYLAFALVTTAWQMCLFFLAYALFYALTEPAEKTLVAQLVGTDRKGLAYGWFNCAIGVAALPSSLVFGALYDQLGAMVAFGWGAGLALLAVIVLVFVRAPGRPADADDSSAAGR